MSETLEQALFRLLEQAQRREDRIAEILKAARKAHPDNPELKTVLDLIELELP
jgi:hypothetical protein